MARCRFEKKIDFSLNITQDALEIMKIAQHACNSGIVTLGDTSGQNMVNTLEISSYINTNEFAGA